MYLVAKNKRHQKDSLKSNFKHSTDMADVLDIHEGDDEFQVDEEGDSEYTMMISSITAIHSLLLLID